MRYFCNMLNSTSVRQEWIGKLGIESLNEMQEASIQSISKQDQIILLSSTGSGKTLAYLIPLLESVDPNNKMTQALVMVPSRELALQVESVLKKMQPGYKITACYGGHKREIEENNLLQAPAIIIGTAGRMADHLRRGNINPSAIQFLVLDEFDKMLELGFLEEMQFILQSLPAVKKRMLTSATAAVEIPAFVEMNEATRLNYLSDAPLPVEKLSIRVIESGQKDKLDTLINLLCFLRDTSTIIFCNHRDAVERTSSYLNENGILNVFYHGGMEQHDREVALCKFRNGTSNVLVTTDLASRGLDIAHIRSVVHYHLPPDEQSFTHRNGRTARMDATGNVYLLIGPEEKVPEYTIGESVLFALPEGLGLPDKPKWSTIFIAAGKKNKINKIDIVGFLTNKGKLKKDEIGLIEVKDFAAFAAIRKSKAGILLEQIKNEKIKNQKVKIALAK